MAYVTDRAPFNPAALALRIKALVRSSNRKVRSHYEPRVSEQELNQRALDRVMMQAICARGFA